MTTALRTHEPALVTPSNFVRGIWSDLLRSRPLAIEIAKRDLRRQYRRKLWGATTVMLPPLVLTAVALGFRRTGILNVDSSSIPYPLFVLAGVILWTTFIEALNAPIYGLGAELRLLAHTNAPPEAILIGKLATVFFNLLMKIILLAAAILWYRLSVPATAIFAPVGLLSLAVLGTAVGLLIAPIHLLYQNISFILGAVTTLWFFFSPIYFPAAKGGMIGAIMTINPVTPLLSATRSLMLAGTVANPLRSGLVALSACALLAPCWLYARVVLRVAIEQVSD